MIVLEYASGGITIQRVVRTYKRESFNISFLLIPTARDIQTGRQIVS